MTPDDLSAFHVGVVETLANLGAMLEPVLEAVEGYRLARVADGYSEGQARQMATDYHSAILKTIL